MPYFFLVIPAKVKHFKLCITISNFCLLSLGHKRVLKCSNEKDLNIGLWNEEKKTSIFRKNVAQTVLN